MKEYPKTFENVYLSQRSERLVRRDRIEIADMTMMQYTDLTRAFWRDTSDKVFEMVVKCIWIQRKFKYSGKRASEHRRNGIWPNVVLSAICRNDVGFDRSVFTASFFFAKIVSYIDDLFADFDKHDPFTEPEYFKMPYDLTIDFLTLVYQMPERLEYLQIAHDRKYTISQFMDFVINQTFSINEEAGYEVYTFSKRTACPPYVRYNDSPKNKIEDEQRSQNLKKLMRRRRLKIA